MLPRRIKLLEAESKNADETVDAKTHHDGQNVTDESKDRRDEAAEKGANNSQDSGKKGTDQLAVKKRRSVEKKKLQHERRQLNIPNTGKEGENSTDVAASDAHDCTESREDGLDPR